MSTIRFDDQIIIITGGGGGLGSAYALLLAERGATVVVHDAGVDQAGHGGDTSVAEKAADEIRQRGGKATAATQNLSTRSACEELINQTVAEYGRIDAPVSYTHLTLPTILLV